MQFRLPETMDYVFILTFLGIIFAAGIWKQDVDGDVIDIRKDVTAINQELLFRAQIRNQIMDKLNSIEHRLSMIEGKLDRGR